MATQTNTAAFIPSASTPFSVQTLPTPTPGPNQILIKTHALAMNPIDVKIQATDFFKLTYPTILGLDVAGEVVSVGPSSPNDSNTNGANSARFSPGDRVMGMACGYFNRESHAEKGFQTYVVMRPEVTCKIPDGVSYERAVVMPLGVCTAASALFNPDMLGLRVPTLSKATADGGKGGGKETLLVWGGASSVGSNAIQLAVAAGYEVVTTASPKNFEMVKALGAKAVFDYKSEAVVDEILAAYEKGGWKSVGALDAIGHGAWVKPLEFAKGFDGGVKLVITVTGGFEDPPEGVVLKHTQGNSILNNHVAKAVWEDFLPQAFELGSYVPSPEPCVYGEGLESVQGAVDYLGKGVSAKKVVVTL